MKSLIEHVVYILTSIEAALAWVLVVPATLAIYAVEATQLRLYGE
jgi:hypothetical protein